MNVKKEMWEILIPASDNQGLDFTIDHHKVWDEFVKGVSGGLTVMKSAKGEWIDPSGILYKDRVIPCRIICTREQIESIITYTIGHYNQKAILAYKISEEVILKYKDGK